MTPLLRRRATTAGGLVLACLIASVVGPGRASAADDDGGGDSGGDSGGDELRVFLADTDNIICWEMPNPMDPCRVVVRLSRPARMPVSVVFVTLDGTAVAPEDYEAVVDRVTVPAGELAVEVTLRTRDDRAREPDEWFHVSISNPSAGRIGDERAEVTIQDGAAPIRG